MFLECQGLSWDSSTTSASCRGRASHGIAFRSKMPCMRFAVCNKLLPRDLPFESRVSHGCILLQQRTSNGYSHVTQYQMHLQVSMCSPVGCSFLRQSVSELSTFCISMQIESRWPSLSALDRRICELFFYWDVFNVFLGAMFGGAIFSQLKASITDPGDTQTHGP